MIKNKESRGLRNNNPLNIIRTKSKWVGLCELQEDLRFCQFQDLRWGWRAAFYLLTKVYYGKYNINTVEGIISRWAPDNENDTIKYVEYVCKVTGFYSCEVLGSPEKNPAMWMALAYAMAKMENGSHAFIDPVPMLQGWRLLFKVDKDEESSSVEHDENL